MGINRHLSLVDSNDGCVRLSISDEHLNRNGTAHGGVLCTLADWAMASKVLSLIAPNQTTATIEITTKFFRRAKIGDELRTFVEVANQGKNMISIDCEIKNSKDIIVCKSYATFVVLEKN